MIPNLCDDDELRLTENANTRNRFQGLEHNLDEADGEHPEEELSGTALKLSKVIEREAKRRVILESGQGPQWASVYHQLGINANKDNHASFITARRNHLTKKRPSAAILPAPDPKVLRKSMQKGKNGSLNNSIGNEYERGQDERSGSEFTLTKTQQIWLFMEDPNSSTSAYYFSMFMFGFITLSTLIFILQTESRLIQFDYVLAWFEMICAVVFTIELILRLCSCPSLTRFAKNYLNWIDVASIIPFYLEAVLSVEYASGMGALRIIRLVRVARVLKMSRYSSAIQIFIQSLIVSMQALSMLVFLMALVVIVFSSAIYFAEFTEDGCRKGGWIGDCDSDNAERIYAYSGGEAAARGSQVLRTDPDLPSGRCVCVDPNPYTSIISSFWWCLVTMSTVGYGDMTPVTMQGKIVGCTTLLTGMLVLALPITVIGTNFQKVMKSLAQDTMKSNVDYLKGKRMICRNEIQAILDRFHAVADNIHLDIDDVINVYDTDNSGMLENEELNHFMQDLEALQNRAFMSQHAGTIEPSKSVRPIKQPRSVKKVQEVESENKLPDSHDTERRSSHIPLRKAATQTSLRADSSSSQANRADRRSTAQARLSDAQAAGLDDIVSQSYNARYRTTASLISPRASEIFIPTSLGPESTAESTEVPSVSNPHKEDLSNLSYPLITDESRNSLHVSEEMLERRIAELKHTWEERLVETEQRLDTKFHNLTKILLRIESMMEMQE